MAETSTDFDLVLAEHHHLNQLFAKLQHAIAENAVEGEELTGMVDQLQEHVLQHFDHEENEGLFQRVIAKAPQLDHDATMLKQQHAHLRQLLNDLSVAARQSPFTPAIMQNVADQFHAFKTQFAEHEEGENQLLQEAYDRDVGSKD